MANSPYPEHVITVKEATAKIEQVFGHEDIRVTRMVVETITPAGSTMRLTWDRKDVGQKPERNFTLDDACNRGADDPAFMSTVKERIASGG